MLKPVSNGKLLVSKYTYSFTSYQLDELGEDDDVRSTSHTVYGPMPVEDLMMYFQRFLKTCSYEVPVGKKIGFVDIEQ